MVTILLPIPILYYPAEKVTCALKIFHATNEKFSGKVLE
jgi:hypothetical protein